MVARMEARRIGRQQKQSRGVYAALNPNGPGAGAGAAASSGRNFLKEHVRAIRLREKELKEAKLRQVELENAPPIPANKKYAHIESRLFKPTVASLSAASTPRVESQGLKHKHFGRVPEYLVEKKAKEEAAQRRKDEESRAPKLHCPPGHRILAEDERLETIALLETRKIEVEQQVARLPLRIETDGQRRRQADLNKRLVDIDQALRFLNKPHVLVKEDAVSDQS